MTLAQKNSRILSDADSFGGRWVEAIDACIKIMRPTDTKTTEYVPRLRVDETFMTMDGEATQKTCAVRANKNINNDLMFVNPNCIYAQAVDHATSVRKVVTKVATPKAKNGLQEGAFFKPKVLTSATQSMIAVSGEISDTLPSTFTFETNAEVVCAANNTPFWLASYVQSANREDVWRVWGGLGGGMVGMIVDDISRTMVPVGNIEGPGFAQTGSHAKPDDFMETECACKSGNAAVE